LNVERNSNLEIEKGIGKRKIPERANFRGENFSGGKILGGKIPEGKILGGKIPGSKFLGGKFSRTKNNKYKKFVVFPFKYIFPLLFSSFKSQVMTFKIDEPAPFTPSRPAK